MVDYYSEQQKIEERQAKEEEESYQQKLINLENVLKTDSGKRVIWDILAECGMTDGGFRRNEELQFASGKRDVGIQIIGWMADVDPTAYANLQLYMGSK